MNPWNQLTDIFGRSLDSDNIPEPAADNICIAWPSISKCIAREVSTLRGRKALDFGCGGGLFCRELSGQGFTVIGYDYSKELIKSAKQNITNEIIVTSSHTEMLENGGYDVICSIMVFQFIEDIEATIDSILPLLNENGLIVFAVFNQEFIKDNSETLFFSGFEDYRFGYMELKKGVKIPVYNRSDFDYRELLEARGLKEVYLDYPDFSEEFLSKYEMPFSTVHPEFQIQGFKYKKK